MTDGSSCGNPSDDEDNDDVDDDPRAAEDIKRSEVVVQKQPQQLARKSLFKDRDTVTDIKCNQCYIL